MPMLRTMDRPTNDTLRPKRHCGVDDLLHPVDVGGEARHDDATVGAADQPVQRRPDLALRRADARYLGIRGVAQEQVDAGVAQPRHAGQVGGPPVERHLVELDVAGVPERCPRQRARRWPAHPESSG